MQGTPLWTLVRLHPAWTLVLIAIGILLVLFDWNWFRHPLESYISKKTQREFRISNLHVKLGLSPTIRMHDLVFGNADWGKGEPMASVKTLEFSVSLKDLFDGKVVVPRVALTDAKLIFERLADDRKNWILSDPLATSPSRFRISTLSVNNGQVRYFDYGIPFELSIQGSTFDPRVQATVKDADAKPVNDRYSTRYVFNGKYHDASFSGEALTGDVLSFQESGELFPIKGRLLAGTTKLSVEGSIADAANISAIDVRLSIVGQTLANLYPFLLLPLPASPPYALGGHLTFKGDRYALEDLQGKIGSTDVYGKAAYLEREPRPLLTAELHSKYLNIADLGPLVGIETKPAQGKPVTTQAETNTRGQAAAAERARDADRILPAGSFEGSRLQAIDAQVTLESKRMRVPNVVPLESIRAKLDLRDAILRLTPLDFGFAGGTIAAQVVLDARKPTIASSARVDFRRVRLDRLVPDNPKIAKAAGTLGAHIDLRGTGNSIADMAAKSNGTMSGAIENGRVSNLIDALSGLNGGKAIRLLITGDQDIEVRCGAVALNVKSGQGTTDVFLIDTEQTQILGNGTLDLDRERFDIVVTPKPKKPGILSLRTPIHAYGSFRDPTLELEKVPIAARVGAAVALALVNPLAAVIPLIETGPGQESNCTEVLKSVAAARRQASAAPLKQ
jgi:uncharacterized protein involved in outer membrane biogenesis